MRDSRVFCFSQVKFVKMHKQEKPLSMLWGRYLARNCVPSVPIKCSCWTESVRLFLNYVFVGCELSESKMEETFKTDDTNYQHQLALRTVSHYSSWSITFYNPSAVQTHELPLGFRSCVAAQLSVSEMHVIRYYG